MSEVRTFAHIDILDKPTLVVHEDGTSTVVLATEKTSTPDEPLDIVAAVSTSVRSRELLAEFSNKVLARMPATYVVGHIRDDIVSQRVVKEKTFGGTRIPFFERRVRRAQKKVGRTVMQHLAS